MSVSFTNLVTHYNCHDDGNSNTNVCNAGALRSSHLHDIEYIIIFFQSTVYQVMHIVDFIASSIVMSIMYIQLEKLKTSNSFTFFLFSI